MRNLILLIITLVTATLAIYIGESRTDAAVAVAAAGADERPAAVAPTKAPAKAPEQETVPHIGRIQVLNGCGMEGAANRMADFLREKKFDVKDIDNAPSWNYDSTLVISRTTNMNLAHEVDKHLKTGKVVLMRDGKDLYDVTVIVGPDYQEKIK